MRKLFIFRPIVFVGCSLVLGIIFSAAFSKYDIAYALIPIAAIAIATIVAFIVNGKKKCLAFGVFAMISFAVGALRTGLIVNDNFIRLAPEEAVTFSGRVETVFSCDNGAERVILKNVKCSDLSVEGANVLCGITGKAEVGEEYTVTATLEKISFDTVDNFYFPQVVSFKARKTVSCVKTGSVGDFFSATRIRLKTELANRLDGETSAFITALIIGDSNGIDPELYSGLRSAGVAHIFAVSGLHIGFFAIIVTAVLSLIGIRRLKKDIVVLVLTFLYSGVCGFSVSSIRAVVMCFILGAAYSLGLKKDMLNAIFLSMIVVLTAFPASLFSYGFLLSYSAIVSIALFNATFKDVFSFMPDKLRNAFSVALAAFIGTAPILAIMLREVSLITVLTNIVVLPIAVFLYYYTFAALLVTLVVPYFGFVFTISDLVVKMISGVTSAIDFDNFILRGELTYFNTAFYYTTLVFSSEKINLNRKIKRIVSVMPAASLILFV